MNDLDLLIELSKYSIRYGIFNEDALKTMNITIENPDGTESVKELTYGEILYFIEYGTISSPGSFIFKKALGYIKNIFQEKVSEIIDKILLGEIKNSNEIETELNPTRIKIEEYFKNLLINLIDINNVLNHILGNEIKDKYNLNEISKYIKCKIIKNN